MNKKFKISIKKRLALIISHHRKFLFFKLLNSFSRAFLKSYENDNNDHFTNGESRVLEIIASFQPRIIFDIGANIGDWSLLAHDKNPQSSLHSFEPISSVFSKLVSRTSNISNITCNNLALTDHDGKIILNFKEGKSLFTSELPFDEGTEGVRPVQVDAQKGETYSKKYNINVIDFLKIDVEGAEPKVLKGFGSMLENGSIKCLQFEYTVTNVKSGFLLYHFYQYLRPLGYTIGKIYPKSVDFKSYKIEMEDFIGRNFIAVHDSVAKEWIPKLRG